MIPFLIPGHIIVIIPLLSNFCVAIQLGLWQKIELLNFFSRTTPLMGMHTNVYTYLCPCTLIPFIFLDDVPGDTLVSGGDG